MVSSFMLKITKASEEDEEKWFKAAYYFNKHVICILQHVWFQNWLHILPNSYNNQLNKLNKTPEHDAELTLFLAHTVNSFTVT